jgi:hypothetical protein
MQSSPGVTPVSGRKPRGLVGWFLANRGLAERAVVHRKRCAESEDSLVWLRGYAKVSAVVHFRVGDVIERSP